MRAGSSSGWRRVCVILLAVACAGVAAAQVAPAAGNSPPSPINGSAPLYVPDISKMLPQANDRQSISSTMQILVLMTVLTIAPSIILMMTSFVRMVVVLVLLRQALGTQTVPPSQVIIGLALFMTLLVMAPRFETIHREAIEPYLSGKMEQGDALSVAGGHMQIGRAHV